MQAFKCPGCGGDVYYDINRESIVCGHCGVTIERQKYQDYLDENGLYVTNELQCPQCGGTVLCYDDTISTFCSYCGASVELSRHTVEDMKPEKIVPFKITPARALKLYNQKLLKSIFAPDWLTDGGTEKLRGIYMPYYVFSTNIEGEFKAPHLINSKQTQSTINANYENTRFDASTAFPDSLSESIDDYSLRDALPFDPTYLAGFYADSGTADAGDYAKIVNEMINADFKEEAIERIGTGIPVTVDYKLNTKASKMLLPVWFNIHRNKDRVCYSVINGQKGTVAADIPIDKWKYIKISVIAAALISLVLNWIFTFKPVAFTVVSMIVLAGFGFILMRVAKDLYIRDRGLDDLGKIGMAKFKETAHIEKAAKTKSSIRYNLAKWVFSVPLSVKLKSWWKTLAGLVISLAVIISGTVIDSFYYAAAAVNIALAIWSAFDMIERQNLLSSRDIPVFTMKRGGDELGK